MTPKVISTSYGDIACEDSGAGQTCLVFLHGGASNLRCWDDVRGYLDETRYRMVTIDLPAHGKSGTPHLGFNDLSQALFEVLRQLEIHRPAVVGHSFGGLAAAKLAQSFPEFVLGVMAVDPYLDSKEIKRSYSSLNEALDQVRNIEWPWLEVHDLDAEVQRCVATYSPRANQKTLEGMIRRGYRKQAGGEFLRFPRREDEMKGVAANWSIDVSELFLALACPLSIAVSKDRVWRLEKRNENLETLSRYRTHFSSATFNCNHDIPGLLPKQLSSYIDEWVMGITHI